MKERPILFSGPMVRALLEGSKTQTRRVCKPAQAHALSCVVEVPDPQERGQVYNRSHFGNEEGGIQFACPYGGKGDRLWVRETFVQGWPYDAVTDRCLQFDEAGKEVPKKTWYRADGSDIGWCDADGWEAPVPWKPSIHMPRWASRILLEITDVRVERLQAISRTDAQAEGCAHDDPCDHVRHSCSSIGCEGPNHRVGFRKLWEQINGADSWATNPWVWAISFRRLEGNQP
ncbi:MAG: hypothetical protein EOP24_26615 [Hyphomicrobiales bacterium]|nr:MAG: hypothetical protein EOP24_26615 [Hyphomicrobiales bacterium]